MLRLNRSGPVCTKGPFANGPVCVNGYIRDRSRKSNLEAGTWCAQCFISEYCAYQVQASRFNFPVCTWYAQCFISEYCAYQVQGPDSTFRYVHGMHST